MSRDFILVFSGGLVSLVTTLVVLFVMDYYYRRLDRERGTSPSPTVPTNTKPVVQPIVPAIVKPVEQPKPVTPTQPTQAETPKPVVAAQVEMPKPVVAAQVEPPKPVAPKPEPKPMPAYVPSKDSLLPPQLRKSAMPEKSEERKESASHVNDPSKSATQEQEAPKKAPDSSHPHDLPPETMKK
jgi:hypothetical protein